VKTDRCRLVHGYGVSGKIFHGAHELGDRTPTTGKTAHHVEYGRDWHAAGCWRKICCGIKSLHSRTSGSREMITVVGAINACR